MGNKPNAKRWKQGDRMKYVKMLGLAAVAAAALMAFVGASTASATVLCKVAVNTTTGVCPTSPANEKYPKETEIAAELNNGATEPAELETEFLTIKCEASTVSGKTENEGSSTTTVKGPISTLTFTKCNCPVTVLKPGSLEIHWISGTDNGTVTSSNAEVTVNCSTIFGTVHCIYVTNSTDLGTLTGGTTATLTANASIPRVTTNALCANLALWKAKYKVTKPDSLFVGLS
jgi:hypothetical protein